MDTTIVSALLFGILFFPMLPLFWKSIVEFKDDCIRIINSSDDEDEE